MRKLIIAVTFLSVLGMLAAPFAIFAASGVQTYPEPPYKIIRVRWGENGTLYYYGVPTGHFAKDVFANSQTRYVYWRNTNGVYRYFRLPDGCSVSLEWQERFFTKRFFWWGSYEYRWRAQKILGPR